MDQMPQSTHPNDDAAADDAGQPQSTQSGSSEIGSGSNGTTKKRLPHERWIGKRLSHFRFLRLLGSGTMGVVFQAEDVNLNRIVALKVLRRQMKGEQQAKQVERFLLEARAAAAIDHPNIAQIFEINEHAAWWYIAMEFMEGGSLEQILQNTGPLHPGQAALMLAEATRGLQAAHEAGIIHRDVKPGNLMLSRRGWCKLVDFGLVKLNSAENPFRDDDRLVVGTPLYVAPEVIQKKGAIPASDIYSLGATLYHLLTGRPPYIAKAITDILKKHVEADIPDVREKNPQCSEHMANIIALCMAKNPADRPDADTLATMLQNEAAVTLAQEPSLSWPSASSSPSDKNASYGGGSAFLFQKTDSGIRLSGLQEALQSGSMAASATPPPEKTKRRWPWIVGIVAAVLVIAGVLWWWQQN